MPRPSSPTPTEWEMELLKILWEKGRSSVDEVRETLREKGVKRSDSAVRKMLLVLVEKGLATADGEERTRYYQAAVKRNQIEKSFFNYVIKCLFGGDEEVFLLRALDETHVTPDLVKKMKKKLEEHSKK